MKTEKRSRYNKAKHDNVTTINYKINIIYKGLRILLALDFLIATLKFARKQKNAFQNSKGK